MSTLGYLIPVDRYVIQNTYANLSYYIDYLLKQYLAVMPGYRAWENNLSIEDRHEYERFKGLFPTYLEQNSLNSDLYNRTKFSEYRERLKHALTLDNEVIYVNDSKIVNLINQFQNLDRTQYEQDQIVIV